MDSFHILNTIGKGTFGFVRAVQLKSTGQFLALKFLDKQTCLQRRAISNTIHERNILQRLNHPLIVNLRFAFQDRKNLYMALDLYTGGDLKYHLKQTGSFPEDIVRFFAAELVTAVEYIHSQHIIHRDIKPGNILLDHNGHVHLTDFNIAIEFPQDPHSGSLIKGSAGTVAYMAPEVITKSGYNHSADIWSLGVVLYELAVGRRPWKSQSSTTVEEKQKELRARIVQKKLKFPTAAIKRISLDFIDLIDKMLEKDPIYRISIEDIKTHAFFANINWQMASTLQLVPTFIPDPSINHYNPNLEESAPDPLNMSEDSKEDVHIRDFLDYPI